MTVKIYPRHKSVNFHPCQVLTQSHEFQGWVLGGVGTGKAGATCNHRLRFQLQQLPGRSDWPPQTGGICSCPPCLDIQSWCCIRAGHSSPSSTGNLPSGGHKVCSENFPGRSMTWICSPCAEKYQIWDKRAAEGWTREKEFVPWVAHSKIWNLNNYFF